MAQKSFTFDFEDKSPKSIGYECDGTEHLRTSVEADGPFVYANRAGMLALAKLLIKLSVGEYKQGFHIHLRSDFSGDAAQPDVLTILLDESVDTQPEVNEFYKKECQEKSSALTGERDCFSTSSPL